MKRLKGNEKQWLMGDYVTNDSVQLPTEVDDATETAATMSLVLWLRRDLCYSHMKGQLNEWCKCKHTLGSPTHSLAARQQCGYPEQTLHKYFKWNCVTKKRNKNRDYKDVQVIIESSHCRYLCFMCVWGREGGFAFVLSAASVCIMWTEYCPYSMLHFHSSCKMMTFVPT